MLLTTGSLAFPQLQQSLSHDIVAYFGMHAEQQMQSCESPLALTALHDTLASASSVVNQRRDATGEHVGHVKLL